MCSIKEGFIVSHSQKSLIQSASCIFIGSIPPPSTLSYTEVASVKRARWINSVRFSPDRIMIVIGDAGGRLTIHEVNSCLTTVATLTLEDAILSLDRSPDC